MVVKFFMDMIFGFVNWIFDLLPDLPQAPASITSVISTFEVLLGDCLGIVSFFIRLDTVILILGYYFVLMNFEEIISVVKWVLKKIPFINVRW